MNETKLIDLINATNYHIVKFVESELRKYNQSDIKYSHYEIMRTLLNTHLPNMDQISKSINKHKSTVTSLVKKLMNKNFISTKKSNKDERKFYLELTDEGKKFASLINNIEQKVFLKVHKSISFPEQIELQKKLIKLKESF